MADIQAKRAYETVIAMLDHASLKYERDNENLRIKCGFNTDDLEITLLFSIDEERELVRIFSPLPFHFPEDKRIDGAVAVCVANHNMVSGSFDYDLFGGEINFKFVNSYKGDLFSEEIAHYMLTIALSTVDHYNDRFYSLAKGFITVSEFIEKED